MKTTTTTTREYDDAGRCLKEIIVIETISEKETDFPYATPGVPYIYYPLPAYPKWHSPDITCSCENKEI